MSLFCRHKWAQADKTVLPSAYEQMHEQDSVRITGAGGDLFRKAVVYLIRCEKCGAAKTIKEVNP